MMMNSIDQVRTLLCPDISLTEFSAQLSDQALAEVARHYHSYADEFTIDEMFQKPLIAVHLRFGDCPIDMMLTYEPSEDENVRRHSIKVVQVGTRLADFKLF